MPILRCDRCGKTMDVSTNQKIIAKINPPVHGRTKDGICGGRFR